MPGTIIADRGRHRAALSEAEQRPAAASTRSCRSRRHQPADHLRAAAGADRRRPRSVDHRVRRRRLGRLPGVGVERRQHLCAGRHDLSRRAPGRVDRRAAAATPTRTRPTRCRSTWPRARAACCPARLADADNFVTLVLLRRRAGRRIETATLTAAYRYDLTYLRRGVYGTPINAHSGGAQLRALRPERPVAVPLPLSGAALSGRRST